MKNIKHIFFDLDHTLWDFDKNSSEALTEIYFEMDLDREIGNLEQFIKKYQEINAGYWSKYNHGLVTKEQIRVGRFRDALNAFEVTNPNERAELLGTSYIQRSPHKKHIFPHAHESLTYLKSKYELHIITNGFKEVQFIKLDNCDLTSYFDLILCTEEVGVNKPNPLVFETALSRTNAIPEESLMIGDNPETDIIGAQNCNMHTILFNPNEIAHGVNSAEIRGLNELITLL